MRAISEMGQLSESDAARIGGAVARWLADLHSQRAAVVGLHPASIFVGRDGDVEIGMAHDDRRYRSPEQVFGEAVGGPADIYALGLILCEALTGTRQPFRLTEGPYVSPSIPTKFGPRWSALLTAMTARWPDVRPTAVEVVRLLESFAPATYAAEVGQVTLVPGPRPGRDRFANAKRGMVGLLGAAALAALFVDSVTVPPQVVAPTQVVAIERNTLPELDDPAASVNIPVVEAPPVVEPVAVQAVATRTTRRTTAAAAPVDYPGNSNGPQGAAKGADKGKNR